MDLMTALDQYTRLETLGSWRETPESSAKEVVVSFGNATLVLSDLDENPLCHWAMAATQRIDLDGDRAVYTPDTQGFETLEIDDANMVEAIAKVALSMRAKKRKTPWLRWVLILLGLGIIGAGAYKTPTLLRAQANRMTSIESARKIGTDMVTTLGLSTCHNARAVQIKDLLISRTFPELDVALIVIAQPSTPTLFPGNVILLGDSELQTFASADDFSHAMREIVDHAGGISGSEIFAHAPLSELYSYITSGELSVEFLRNTAKHIIERDLDLPGSNFTNPEKPVLRDQDWVALQGICLN